MSKVTKEDLMDYLYDELTPERRQEVTEWLENNPEAQAELDELQGVRSVLSELPDTPVERPVLMMDSPPAPNNHRVGWPRALMAVAAAVIVIFLVGALGRMQVQMGNGSFSIAFNTATETHHGLTTAQVDSMLSVRMAQQSQVTLAKQDSSNQILEAWQENLLGQVAILQQTTKNLQNQAEAPIPIGITEDELFATLRDLQEENLRLMMALVENSSEDLRLEMQNTLITMAQYYDVQRNQDLLQLEQNLADIQQVNQETQQRTEFLYNVLASSND